MRRGLATAVVMTAVALIGCGTLPELEEDTSETLQIESVDLPGRLWDPFMPRGVTYGYDAKAHAEAKTLLIEFLSEVFAQD